MIRTNLIKTALTAVVLTLSFSAAGAQGINSTNNTGVALPFMYYGMPYVGQVSGVYGYSTVPMGIAPLGSPFGIPFGLLTGAGLGNFYVSGFSGPPPGYSNGHPDNGDYGPGYDNTANPGEPGAPIEGNTSGTNGYDNAGNDMATNANATWGNQTNASAGRNLARQNPVVVRPAPYGRIDVIYRGNTADVSRITMMVLDKNWRELNESVLTGPPARARLTRYTNAKYYRAIVDYKDGTTVAYTGPLSR